MLLVSSCDDLVVIYASSPGAKLENGDLLYRYNNILYHLKGNFVLLFMVLFVLQGSKKSMRKP